MVTQFEGDIKEKRESYKNKTSRQKYLKNEDYKEFKEAIFVSLLAFALLDQPRLSFSYSKSITKARLCLL